MDGLPPNRLTDQYTCPVVSWTGDDQHYTDTPRGEEPLGHSVYRSISTKARKYT